MACIFSTQRGYPCVLAFATDAKGNAVVEKIR
jgi:hypothetical protein